MTHTDLTPPAPLSLKGEGGDRCARDASRKGSRMLRAYRGAALAAAGLSTFALAGCPNDYTCYDYRDCPAEGGVEGGMTSGIDARSDRSQTAHDGGSDATKDGTTDGHVVEVGTEGGTNETGSPDVIVTSDGSKDAPVDTFTCIPTSDPSSEPCVINEMFGVFVAPAASGGSDTTGMGSRAAPYATISHALASLGTLTRVYACAGTYAEAVTVNAAVDGVQVYGGLVCPGSDGGSGAWTYGSGFASVAPATRGFALDVESLVKGALFEDIGFTSMAGDPTVPGAWSIAVMVNASTGVSFTRVHATAGAGVAGANGVAVPAVAGGTGTNWCPTAGQGGQAATGTGGGNSGVCTCGVVTADSSSGGPGGSKTLQGSDGDSVPPVTNTAAPLDGKGEPGSSTGSGGTCLNGHAGAPGISTSAGSLGSVGTLSSGGWSTESAGPGGAGNPGQGGGGGGGSATIGGAGGGAGGCGGNGGVGGSGGGASLSIAVVNSTVTLASLNLATGAGGAGGGGADGEMAQAGGAKGVDPTTSDGCNGGPGGAGAGGSGGGGGAGGPSVGIAWTGSTTSLTLDGMPVTALQSLTTPSSFAMGGGGALGVGGTAGAAATGGNPGVAGQPGPAGSSNAVVEF